MADSPTASSASWPGEEPAAARSGPAARAGLAAGAVGGAIPGAGRLLGVPAGSGRWRLRAWSAASSWPRRRAGAVPGRLTRVGGTRPGRRPADPVGRRWRQSISPSVDFVVGDEFDAEDTADIRYLGQQI